MQNTLQIPLLLFDPALACDDILSHCLCGYPLHFLMCKTICPNCKNKGMMGEFIIIIIIIIIIINRKNSKKCFTLYHSRFFVGVCCSNYEVKLPSLNI
jgi:hypothetical protein